MDVKERRFHTKKHWFFVSVGGHIYVFMIAVGPLTISWDRKL